MKTKLRIVGWLVLLALSMFNLQLSTAHAQGTAFTYQGRLNNGANPAGGIYDLRFTVYDAAGGGSASGVLTNAATPVTNGLFTVTLDFGSGVFTGPGRWLEIAVRTNGASAFTPLAPRQPVTPTPYAITASSLNGTLPAAQLTGALPSAQLAGTYSGPVTFNNGADTFDGTFYGNFLGLNFIGGSFSGQFIGDGGSLINLAASQLTGTVPDARLSANVARLNGTNNFTGTNTFAGVTIATNVNDVFAGTFLGNGGGLTNLNTAQFANSVLTNNQTGVTLNGTFVGNGASLTNVNAAALNGLSATSFWQLGGNNVSSGQFLGSTNSQALEFKVNNVRALRLEPTTTDSTHSNIVNVVGGSPINTIASGVYGSVIAGGGAGNYSGLTAASNSISSDMSFIGGGWGNSIQTSATSSFLGGGAINSIQQGAYLSFLGGGQGNYLSASNSFLGGGYNNSIQTNAQYSVLGGGNGNSIQPIAQYSVLGGGSGNSIQLNAWQSFLGGGQDNSIQPNAYRSFLGGGYYNSIQTNAYYSVLGGGSANSIQLNASGSFLGGGSGNSIQTSAYQSFLGGGLDNSIQPNAYRSFLGGGYNNSIQLNAYYSFLGGGTNNSIQTNASYSVLGGGQDNSIQTNAYYSVLGGGDNNSIQTSAADSVLGGGYYNSIQTNAAYSFLGGGKSNVVSGMGAVVVGGGYDGSSTLGNTASGAASVVVGGTQNTAGGNRSTVGGGADNVATNYYATIPGGAWNVAGGQGSFAAGQAARALHDGSFVWNCDYAYTLSSSAANQFMARAEGGFYFYTGSGSSGATLAAGATSWSVLSDRNAKKDFAAVNPVQILDKLAAVPISQWHYKWESADTTPHIGPMAQDFKAAFYPGRDDKSITTLEFDGVELAAIQGLNRKLEQKETEITELKARLERLEQLVNAKNGGGQ